MASPWWGVANQGRRRKDCEGAEMGKQLEFVPGVIRSTIGVAPGRLSPRGSGERKMMSFEYDDLVIMEYCPHSQI
ncbi:hypothetical protein [Moorena sp. SIO4G3]|uniref:hypothetical protein n=1 Tax=Moorena sp. SIO4G3 TaxID=2607821 RepID=UPI00142C89F4|nr:hypothetical protein [Moorena sp. SIO4G3]NEO79649.1 hypothetical protein [Moorena sp. SIO4G3]